MTTTNPVEELPAPCGERSTPTAAPTRWPTAAGSVATAPVWWALAFYGGPSSVPLGAIAAIWMAP